MPVEPAAAFDDHPFESMREAHAHIASFGQSLAMPSLAACRSVGECLSAVADASQGIAAPGAAPAWVRLHSARIQAWDEPRWPTRLELDRVTGGRPCVILSFDHHAACANSAALAAAGLSAGEVVPPNGLVCADPASGLPTGELVEQAAFKVWEAAPAPTAAERARHVRDSLTALAALGYHEVHDLLSQDWLGPVLAAMERDGTLPVREVHLYPPIARVGTIASSRSEWESGRVRLAGGKLFADGTLNSRTALMLEPYREPVDGLPCGQAMVEPRQIDAAVTLCESLGLHLAVHAIGDGAVRMVLDAIERTSRAGAGRHGSSRHRVEHCELIDDADVPRFAALGVVCSVQPCHLLADVEVLRRQLPHRLHRVLPLRELIQTGCGPFGEDPLLWFGSDVPVVRPDPQDSVQAAVNRRRAGAPPADAIGSEQRLSEAEAWAAFGRASA